MAAALDSKFEDSKTGTHSSFSFVSNAGNVTGTVGGSNRVLIGVCECSFPIATVELTTPLVMTWDGVSMTRLTQLDFAGTRSIYLFGLIAPNTGNKSLASAYSNNNMTIYMGAICVSGADQSTGWQNVGTDTGTGTSGSSVVTTASGNFAIAGHGDDNGSSVSLTAGTSAWLDTRNDTNAGQAYVASSGSSATISWGWTGSKAWGHVKVDVIAAGGGAAAVYRKLGLLGAGL